MSTPNPSTATTKTTRQLERMLENVAREIQENSAHSLHAAGDVSRLLEGGLVLTKKERNNLAHELYLGGYEHPDYLLPEARFSANGRGAPSNDTTDRPDTDERSTVEQVESIIIGTSNTIQDNRAGSDALQESVAQLLEGGTVLTREQRQDVVDSLSESGVARANDQVPVARFSIDPEGRPRGADSDGKSTSQRKSTTETTADKLADSVPLPGARKARIEQQKSYAGSGATRET